MSEITEKRDYSFVKDNWNNKKIIEAKNLKTNEKSYYGSLYRCSKFLQVNQGLISMICKHKQFCKTAKSKKDGNSYTFNYVSQLPEGTQLINVPRKPRSDNLKKLEKEFNELFGN